MESVRTRAPRPPGRRNVRGTGQDLGPLVIDCPYGVVTTPVLAGASPASSVAALGGVTMPAEITIFMPSSTDMSRSVRARHSPREGHHRQTVAEAGDIVAHRSYANAYIEGLYSEDRQISGRAAPTRPLPRTTTQEG